MNGIKKMLRVEGLVVIISNDLTFLNNDKLSEGRTLSENLTSKVAALRNAQLSKVS